MRFLFLLPLLALMACAPGGSPDSRAERRAPMQTGPLPPMKQFGIPHVSRPTRSNREIARDFLDLSFQMESGRPLPIMTRFEGPISLRVTGKIPPSLEPDLNILLSRLRREANINITRVSPQKAANITIELIPHNQLQRLVPNAACFVVPRISSWADYRRLRRSDVTRWATLQKREKLAVFIPGDVSPQELRDCLHEELAQALGPLNDLYRLPDSVFNDDNFHTILTGFDMLVLRTYYAPELQNGMTRSQTAAALPHILARLNPAGQRAATGPLPGPTPRVWINAIETALGRKSSATARRVAASRAVAIAQSAGWNDTRMGFSLYILGRLSLTSKPETALNSFLNSAAVYNNKSETRVQAAHLAMQLAAFALSAGDGETAVELVNANLPAMIESQNAALLSLMLMVKAEALDMMNHPEQAREVRLDSLGWARYGFGSDKVVRRRMAEISALTPIRVPNSMRNL